MEFFENKSFVYKHRAEGESCLSYLPPTVFRYSATHFEHRNATASALYLHLLHTNRHRFFIEQTRDKHTSNT